MTVTTKTISDPKKFTDLPGFICGLDIGKSEMNIGDAREFIAKLVAYEVKWALENQDLFTSGVNSPVMELIEDRIIKLYRKAKAKK